MNVMIRFDGRLSTWHIFLNEELFVIHFGLDIKEGLFWSYNFQDYFISLKVLRQFGTILKLKNNEEF
jgi:hypothetical protein